MRPITIVRQLDTADQNGIAQAQTTAGAADLVLNGALVSGGVAQLGSQRKVAGTSAANISTVVFTVYGTDDSGNSIVDTITGINNSTVSTTLDFATVTQISTSAAVGSNVEFGTTGVGASVVIPLDLYIAPFNVSLVVEVSGTVDVTVQYTSDNIFSGYGPFVWFDHADLTNVTANDAGSLVSPVSAVRLLTNSGTGTATMIVRQSGIR